MAVYKVGADGRAPKGLSVGDRVVTGGGMFEIKAVRPDGTYDSFLYDASINTSNYGNYESGRGAGGISEAQRYAQANTAGSQAQRAQQSGVWAGSGKTVSNYGQGTLRKNEDNSISRTLNGRTYYVNPGDEKYESINNEYMKSIQPPISAQIQDIPIPEYVEPDTAGYEAQVNKLIAEMQKPYTPVDQSQYLDNVMGYEEAQELATKLIAPKYAQYLEQAKANAAQNLDRAGLYNTLYGQGLSMAAENQVSAEQQQAINDLSIALVGQDRDYALQRLNMAINENQYGSGYNQSGLGNAAKLSIGMIDNMVARANARNDYAAKMAGLQLQKQAAALEARYQEGKISQMQLENKLAELELQALETEMKSGGGGGGGGGRSGGSGSGGGYSYGGAALPRAESDVRPTASAESRVSSTDNDNAFRELYTKIYGGFIPNYISAVELVQNNQNRLTEDQQKILLRTAAIVYEKQNF